MKSYNKKQKIEVILLGIWEMASEALQKNAAIVCEITTRTIQDFREAVRQSAAVYQSWNPLKLGGMTKKGPGNAYHDFTESAKLKYNQGMLFLFYYYH